MQCVHLTGKRCASLACPMAQDQPSDGLLTSPSICTICRDLLSLRTGTSRNDITKTSREAFVHHSFPIPPQAIGQKAGVCTQLSKGTDHMSLALLLEGIDLALELDQGGQGKTSWSLSSAT